MSGAFFCVSYHFFLHFGILKEKLQLKCIIKLEQKKLLSVQPLWLKRGGPLRNKLLFGKTEFRAVIYCLNKVWANGGEFPMRQHRGSNASIDCQQTEVQCYLRTTVLLFRIL